MAEIVTVVNRTTDKLVWMFDGRTYELKGREERMMSSDVAQHGYHKTKFGFNMEDGSWHHAMGIKEWNQDCEPISNKPSDFDEIFDRSTDITGAKVVKQKFSNPDLARSRPIESAL